MLKPPSLLARAVPPLAACKLLLGLAAFAATWREGAGRNPDFPYSFYGLFAVVFGVTGVLLLLGGRDDRRAVALGGFFLVTSTSWSNGPLHLFVEGRPGAWLFAFADALEVNAFMPYFLWAFVRDFPVPPSSLPSRRRVQLMVGGSAVAGAALMLARLPPLDSFLRPLGELFDLVILPLTIAAFPSMLWKSRFARREDAEKVRRFLRRLVAVFGPMVLFLLLELFVAPWRGFVETHPPLRRYLVMATLLPALALPFLVPYAAIVHRVFLVKMVARQALQYTLARWLALTLVTVPLTALAVYLYSHRGKTLTELFSGTRVLLLLGVAAVGVACLRYRRRLLDAVDRRFFREQYDARQILTLLVERIRSIRESPALAALICREIDLALHLEEVGMLALDPRSGMLVDPRSRARKLDASCALALTISNASDPLEVDLEDPRSALHRLPEKERHWLVDSGFRLVVPILSRDGSLLGLIGLGPKRSGLGFLREDRRLLHTIASSAAWVLELEQQEKNGPAPPTPAAAVEQAKECPHCGTLHPSFNVLCSVCSKRLDPSRVPYVLPGKFRIEKRIGVGGMGVVYAGSDLSLGRRVAIKTLRRVSPEDAMRLRHEARTAAAVSHSHLAAVFGLETWRGTPMLIMELLEGGTLADRVQGRLAPRETVELGIDMADALAQLHAAEILHRDIKPSNIGYTRDGVPKLMDFGIAGVIFELRQEEEDLAAARDLEALDGDEETADGVLIPPVAVWDTGSGSDMRQRFAGTLSYLSPEAVRGRPADASFDLWSLSVVLYECLLGRKLFTGAPRQVAERIRSGRIPDFALVCPEHSPALAGFFRDALHPSPYRRPATAQELRSRLAKLRAEL